jgi:hypothetical protein
MRDDMKVYTSVNDYNYSTNVGVVLVGDMNQIYFEDGFKLTTQDKVSAHVYGLKRAISFVKNMKPLYCNNGMLQIFHDNVRVDIDKEVMDRIEADEYIRRFVEERNIKITTKNKDLTDFDKEMLMRAGIKVAPRIFTKGYEKERF